MGLISCAGEKTDRIIVSAPFGPLSYPLVYMEKYNEQSSFAESMELVIWKNPDQLRAMIAGNQADFFALPTNVAALFHNKGMSCKLINVSVWSVLWLVSGDSTKVHLRDFKYQEIVIPFKGDMPHIIFENICKKQGLNPEKDFKLRFVNTPMDAAQQLLIGNADHAVLAEPDISILIYRTKTEKSESAKRFYRAVDFQEEWNKIYGTGVKIPIGGIAVPEKVSVNSELIEKFQKEYAQAVYWCQNHPDETGKLIADYFEGVPSEPIIDAIDHVDQTFVKTKDAISSLEMFFSVLLEGNPASIGGKMPENDFYLEE